jgi:hypothetical protein
MRISLVSAFAGLFLLSTPAFAQQAEYDPVADARAVIESHQVKTRVGCSIPIPATWDAPPWEQQAAMRRRDVFNDCLAGVMEREQERLGELTYRVDDIKTRYPDADWSNVDYALNAKWDELETLESKLRTKEGWANTAVEILDTFTGPGGPFNSSAPSTAYSPYMPYGAPYMTPSPYGYVRRDTSVSAPGIK